MTKYIVTLVASMGIIFGIELSLSLTVFPNIYFQLMPAIPIFFAAFGVIVIKLIYSKAKPSVSAIMMGKMLKILLSLIFILAYIILIKENNTAFLLSFLGYFLVYLVFETWMLSSMNK